MLLVLAIIFLIVALSAGLLGFRTLAGCAATIARFLLMLFLILFLVALLAHLLR